MMKLDGGVFVVGLIASREMRCYAMVEGYAKVMQLALHYDTTLSNSRAVMCEAEEVGGAKAWVLWLEDLRVSIILVWTQRA
ncbi:hypothetical protein D8674_034986 [Pyrus ussuriensis x Pyrus communis]|uniref:Uncharacterized protein n=1 Tax=Pyrus ussuriensis x Pyrus communis TaxID=2448454 RepID=A0A5N5GH45_9ROSA|nr:hypothetical protein D8674_034986 [Pyrus ussuriensis x Pyrus communis]